MSHTAAAAANADAETRPVPSPRRLAANRANAGRSTGPRTAAGKAQSRSNALKHGLSGAGVVQTPALEAAFEAKLQVYTAVLRPRNAVEEDLVRAAALGACRFEQARRDEAAADRLRLARARFDAESARRDALARLPDEPAAALRELTATTDGIDDLITLWNDLDATLAAGRRWNPHELGQALGLLGMTLAQMNRPAGKFLADAIRAMTHHHDRAPEHKQGRAALRDLAARQIDRLRTLRAAIAEVEAEAQARAETSPQPPADDLADQRRLRHETDARRTWQSSLHRLHILRTAKRPADPADPAPTPSAPPPNEPAAPPSTPPQNEPTAPGYAPKSSTIFGPPKGFGLTSRAASRPGRGPARGPVARPGPGWATRRGAAGPPMAF